MSITIDFSGKAAIITGAARGIGKATALAFAEGGAQLVLSDIRDDVEEVAAAIRDQGGSALAIAGDLRDLNVCKSLVDQSMAKYGRLDFAFNNAGVAGTMTPIGDIEPDEWNRVVDINLNSIFYCLKYQVPAMISSGGGVVINTSSVLGLKALQGNSIEYTTAKHGVIGLTRQLAVNDGADGIRCVAVCPGYVRTAATDIELGGDIDASTRQVLTERTPLNRLAEPQDIASAVCLLCSDQAAYISGSYLEVDGGLALT